MNAQTSSQQGESPRKHQHERDTEQNWIQGELHKDLLYMHPAWIQTQTEQEKRRIRPGVLGEHIAEFKTEADAHWVAERLNFAARVQQILERGSKDPLVQNFHINEALEDYKASTR